MTEFQNQHIVVTGATSGIGRATAVRLTGDGAKVIATGRNPERLAEVAGFEGITVLENDSADLDGAAALRAAVDKIFEGRIDGVFLNAGFGAFQPIESVDAAEVARQFDTNVRGPLLQLGALSSAITDGGSVVFNTSVVNDVGMPNSGVYSATKGAVRSAMKVFANELAPRQIRVNAVSPGPIDTGFFGATGLTAEEIDGFATQVLAQVPLGRFGTADEVAAAVVFLLSSKASYITGTELVVDGGMS